MKKTANSGTVFVSVLVFLALAGPVWAFDDSNLVSHWRFDEGAGDIAYDSAGTNDGVVYGANWVDGIIDGALDFDGVNDYVDVGDKASLDFGTDDSFSISVWFKTGKEHSPMIDKRRCAGPGGVFYEGYHFWVAQDKLFSGIEDTSGNNTNIFGTAVVTDNEWHHAAAVRDTSEDKLYLYLDGGPDATPVTDITTETLATSKSFHIGRRDATVHPGYVYYEGKIDDVRIYDRALSAEEIEELYGSGFGGLISHWKFDEGEGDTAYDSAGSNDGTIYGAQWVDGIIDGALDFDGVDDYVDVGDKASLDFGAADSFSISVWFKTGKEHSPIVDKRRCAGPGGVFYEGYHFWVAQDKLYFEIEDTSSNNPNIFGTAVVTDGQWHHAAAVRDTAQDKLYLYLDGGPDATEVTDTTTETLATSKSFHIGRRDSTVHPGYVHYEGKIDDVRIYNVALSPEEIQQLYQPILPDVVAIDIKPQSCPNPLNLKSRGVLPVAVLGSEDFDVNNIDVASIRLADVAPIRSSFEDVATPVADGNECECTAEGPDGYTDLTLKFKTQEIVEKLINAPNELVDGLTLSLTLTGALSDDTLIEGTDCVLLVGNMPRAVAAKRADINGDGVVDFRDLTIVANYWLESSEIE